MSDIAIRMRRHVTSRAPTLEKIKENSAWGMMLEGADEIDRLREKVKNLTVLLDDHLGTPCEQIRHEQEVEKLHDALKDIQRRCGEYEHINVVGPKKAGTIRNCLLIAGAALRGELMS